MVKILPLVPSERFLVSFFIFSKHLSKAQRNNTNNNGLTSMFVSNLIKQGPAMLLYYQQKNGGREKKLTKLCYIFTFVMLDVSIEKKRVRVGCK